MSFINLVTKILLIWGSFQGSKCSLPGNISVISSNHDLNLLVNETQVVTFVLKESNPDSELDINDTIDFKDDSSILEISPSSVQVSTLQNFSVSLYATNAGKTTVIASTTSKQIDLKYAFVRVTVQHSKALDVFSQIIGWIYFVAWSISFYPQIYENWKRKSVIGLSFDFLGLNVIGFFLYSVFNIGLFWIPEIQNQYFKRHHRGVNPVQLNDVIFSLHAVLACIITIVQCFIYERGNQSMSKVCKGIIVLIGLFLVISLILTLSLVVETLDFLYYCSYVKLFITLIKYVPQAYMNFRRKSTLGWSIGNILLDFTGGFLSICQMFVISYNQNDWGSIFGDPTKFGLGLFSVLFDIIFILQHYVFYRNNVPSEELVNDEDLEDPQDDDNRSDT